MVSVIAKLEVVISRHSQTLKCGAIISAFGEVTSRVGDFADFDQQGLAPLATPNVGCNIITSSPTISPI